MATACGTDLQERARTQATRTPEIVCRWALPREQNHLRDLLCFYHGHTRQTFRDIRTMFGDTLAERYERTISLLE